MLNLGSDLGGLYRLQGYEIGKQHSGRLKHCVFTVKSSCVPVYSEGVKDGIKLHSFGARNLVKRRVILDISRRFYFQGRWSEFSGGRRVQTYAGLDVASAVDVINDLGFDTLTFLMVTVIIVPVFRVLKASPVQLNATWSWFIFSVITTWR